MSNSLQGFDVRAASFAADVDQAFWVNFWISVVLGLSVILPMIYFAWKYRESNVKNEEIENVTHNTALEIAWTLIPTALLMVLFYYGYSSMQALRTMPAESESIVVKVEGSKWKWKYEYPANANGYVHKIGGVYDKEKGTMGISALYVPVNTNIILEMTAPLDDVIHSWFVPAFRMKEDVVPGRTTKQWFNADTVGEYEVECAEYCGTLHSYMYSRIVVMEKDAYEAWFNSNEETPKGNFAKTGDALLRDNGCKQCHAIDTDTTIIGPSLKNRLSKEQVLDVINNGQDKLGYPMGAMPAGLASGKDAEEIAAYVANGMKGEQPASFAACSSCHGEDGRGMGGMSPNLVGYDAALLTQVFKHGKKGMIGRMPSYKNMTEEDISIIAEYLDKIK
jgi:cytochrome c oxidase subunit 2